MAARKTSNCCLCGGVAIAVVSMSAWVSLTSLPYGLVRTCSDECVSAKGVEHVPKRCVVEATSSRAEIGSKDELAGLAAGG